MCCQPSSRLLPTGKKYICCHVSFYHRSTQQPTDRIPRNNAGKMPSTAWSSVPSLYLRSPGKKNRPILAFWTENAKKAWDLGQLLIYGILPSMSEGFYQNRTRNHQHPNLSSLLLKVVKFSQFMPKVIMALQETLLWGRRDHSILPRYKRYLVNKHIIKYIKCNT